MDSRYIEEVTEGYQTELSTFDIKKKLNQFQNSCHKIRIKLVECTI